MSLTQKHKYRLLTLRKTKLTKITKQTTEIKLMDENSSCYTSESAKGFGRFLPVCRRFTVILVSVSVLNIVENNMSWLSKNNHININAQRNILRQMTTRAQQLLRRATVAEQSGLKRKGLLCPFPWGELGPHLTQCGVDRGLPPY